MGEGVPAEDMAGAVQVLVAEKPGYRGLGIARRHAPGFTSQPTRAGGERATRQSKGHRSGRPAPARKPRFLQ